MTPECTGKIRVAHEKRKFGLSVSENGCISLPLSQPFRRKPHYNLWSKPTVGCIPLTVNFGTSKIDEGASYEWTLDGKTLQGSDASNTFNSAGSYDLKLKAVSEDGCELVKEYAPYFQANSLPRASFSPTPRTTLSESPMVRCNNTTEGAVSYIWDFGDSTRSTETSPVHTFRTLGTLTIKLIAESEFGCRDSAFDQISVVGSTAVANAFSPHSNVEKNRVFYPIPQGMQLSGYEFRVYNRWGNLVFETADADKGWDGSIAGGSTGTGAFVWTVEYTGMNGQLKKNSGTVIIVE